MWTEEKKKEQSRAMSLYWKSEEGKKKMAQIQRKRQRTVEAKRLAKATISVPTPKDAEAHIDAHRRLMSWDISVTPVNGRVVTSPPGFRIERVVTDADGKLKNVVLEPA